MLEKGNRIRTLLLIEDSAVQKSAYRNLFKENGWEVIDAHDPETALTIYQEQLDKNQPVDVIIMDMGLPPAVDNPREGVKLAQRFRAIDSEVPIMAYTGMALDSELMTEIIAQLLPLRVSFVSARRISHTLGWVEVLNLIDNQFFLLDSRAALALTDAVAAQPDPFSDERYWECMFLLNQKKPYRVIGKEMNVNEETVRKWLRKIKDCLVDKDEIPFDSDRDDIIRWYQENFARYRHIDQLRRKSKNRTVSFGGRRG